MMGLPLNINVNYWILQSIAMGITALFIPGLKVTSPFGPIAAVIALAFVNAHVWDTALFFHLPDSLTAHTFALLVANGVIFWIIVKILPGIEVDGVLPAFMAPVVFTVTSILVSQYGKDIDWAALGQQLLWYIHSIKKALASGSAHTIQNAFTP